MIALPGQKEFDLDEYPLYNLNRTSATYTDVLSMTLKKMGMNQNQWRILAILGDKNPSTVTEIARRGVLKMSTLTRMLDRMEKDELVSRSLWKQDKRVVQIKVTAKGRAALNKMLSAANDVYKKTFAGISDAEVKRLMKTLAKMRDNLNHSSYLNNGK